MTARPDKSTLLATTSGASVLTGPPLDVVVGAENNHPKKQKARWLAGLVASLTELFGDISLWQGVPASKRFLRTPHEDAIA